MTDELADAKRRSEHAEQLESTGTEEERAAERADQREDGSGADWMFRDETPEQPWAPPGTGHIDADPAETPG